MFDLADDFVPEALFDEYTLGDWAEGHDFVRGEDAMHSQFWSRNS